MTGIFARVWDGDVDKGIRLLKKKMGEDGFWRREKLKRYFEKPSDKRRRKIRESIARQKRAEARKLQRRR